MVLPNALIKVNQIFCFFSQFASDFITTGHTGSSAQTSTVLLIDSDSKKMFKLF